MSSPHASGSALLRAVTVLSLFVLDASIAAKAWGQCGRYGHCDDGNACTGDIYCLDFGCKHVPLTCNDHDACTADSCDPATGCVHAGPTCVTTTSVPPPKDGCGDTNADGGIATSDALKALRAATGSGGCELCYCDVDNNGILTATDSLLVLRFAVGQQVLLNCPAC